MTVVTTEPGPSRSQPQAISEAATAESAASGEEEDRTSKPFSGHRDGIMAIAYSPSGKHLATGSPDKTIRIWVVETGVQVGEPMEGHTDEVNTICYSPDGTCLVSGADEGTIRIWNVGEGAHSPAGEPIIAHSSWVMTVKFSPSGKLIASGGNDNLLKLWNAQTQKLVHEFKDHTKAVRQVAWSPDGTLLATGSNDNKIRIFHVDNRKLLMEPISGHRQWVRAVVFSPNGKFLASASDDHSVRVWNVETGKLAKGPFRSHTYWVGCIEWSPDGKRIVSGSHDKTVRVLDFEKGQYLFQRPLFGHSDDIRAVTYSPDGRFFASADMGSRPRIQIWNAQTGKPHFPLLTAKQQAAFEQEAKRPRSEDSEPSQPGMMRAGSAVLAVAWFPDGRRFASAGEDFVVRLWDAATGLQEGEIVSHEEPVNALSISSDSRLLATASDDHTVRLFSLDTKELVMQPLKTHFESVQTITFTPDNSRLVSGGMDKTIRFWNALTGEHQHVIEKHTEPVRSLAVSPDGSKLASGGNDNHIYVWSMHSYELLAGPFVHEDWVRAVCFSPDGTRILSGSDDYRVRVWDLSSGELAFPRIEKHTDWVGAVDWSNDGRWILSAGHDKAVWVWDADTGERVLGPLKGHKKGIRAAAFSPDGTRFLSGSLGHTLCLWDVDTGDFLLRQERTNASNSDSGSESDSSEADPESDNNDANEPRAATVASAGQRARGRQNSDDSFMNWLAVPMNVKQSLRAERFWDDADDEPSSPSKRHRYPKRRGAVDGDNKNADGAKSRQRKRNLLKRIWTRGHSTQDAHDKAISEAKRKEGKKKEHRQSARGMQEASDTNSEQLRLGAKQKPEAHAMRRIFRRPPVTVSPARAKMRVFAAGDEQSTERTRRGQEESSSDSDENDRDEADNVSVDQRNTDRPNTAHDDEDDESAHGLIDTICYCLCLPCCK